MYASKNNALAALAGCARCGRAAHTNSSISAVESSGASSTVLGGSCVTRLHHELASLTSIEKMASVRNAYMHTVARETGERGAISPYLSRRKSGEGRRASLKRDRRGGGVFARARGALAFTHPMVVVVAKQRKSAVE